jgi:spermidine synthase
VEFIVVRGAAAVLHGAPETLRSDNGPEFVSLAMLGWLSRAGVQSAFIAPGKRWQNATNESFNGKFRDECLNMHWFSSRGEARVCIGQWRREYNERRPHSSIVCLTPAAFVRQNRSTPTLVVATRLCTSSWFEETGQVGRTNSTGVEKCGLSGIAFVRIEVRSPTFGDFPMAATTLPAVFFLSGCSALIFENLWFYQARLTFGNSVWASSLVLAGFMGGLAIGNLLAARLKPGKFRPVRTYALLETAIGVSGFALVLALPYMTPVLAAIFGPQLETPWIANTLRLGFAFALLLVPSTAMGATLPVMVSALYQRDARFGAVLGRLYGWNTLGAVVGALAGDVLLIEAVGVRGTGLAAMSISLLVAALALAISRSIQVRETPPVTPPKPTAFTARAWWLLLSAALAGFTLLGLEVVWFRFLLHFTFGSSQTFAILLAVVLAGIGIGGLLGGLLSKDEERAERFLPFAAAITGCIAIALYWAFPSGPPDYSWGSTLVRGLVLMFPVALCSGVLFTLMGTALKHEVEPETRATGLLTLANTTGAALGPLFVGFYFMPEFGIDRTVQVMSAAYLVVALATFVSQKRAHTVRERWALTAPVFALIAALAVFPGSTTLSRHLAPVIDPFTKDIGAKSLAIREGVTETVVYTGFEAFGEPVWYRMLTNGYSMSGTSIEGQRYMKLFVYLPMALNPDIKSALLISYGVGSTAKALTYTASIGEIDVVDISKDVLEMNDIVYPDPEDLPLTDSRVAVHVEDGRYFMLTTKKRFDLITGEPPPPKKAGIVSLYTREYFALARDRLTEGGIMSYWLPVQILRPEDAHSIIRAFCDVFTDCSLWGGTAFDWILIGTRGAKGPETASRLAAQWADPIVRADLAAIGIEQPAQLSALFMAGPDHLKEVTRDALPLTDDHPKRLSDEPFDLQSGAVGYARWMEPTTTQARFTEDSWLDQVWPDEFRQPDPIYFVAQWELNRHIIEKPYELEVVLPRVHFFLSETDLSTLPLWLLNSHSLRQHAAKTSVAKGREQAEAYYELALGDLAARRFQLAEQGFDRAMDLGDATTRQQVLKVYSRFMHLDLDGKLGLVAVLEGLPPDAGVPTWLTKFLRSIITQSN